MLHRIARRIWFLWFAATLAVTGWTLAQNPFAAPFVARSTEQARLALTRAVAETATPDWLVPRLDAALDAEDADRASLFADLAADQEIAIGPDRQQRLDRLLAADDGIAATVAACGSCAIDIASCPSLRMIGACAIPFELSPAGDVAALGRAGVAVVTDEEVDKIEASLAAIGLGATVATVASAGTSAPVKVGASVLRVARRMDALSPGLLSALGRAATSGATDEIATLAGDFGRLRDATSSAEALTLLRLADDPADLARLSRVAEAAGPDTRRTFEVLGKARTLRLLDRVSTLALAAAGLIALVAGQVLSLLVSLAGRTLLPRDTGARGR